MKEKILIIQDRIFVHLSEIHEKNKDLKFTLRKSNLGNKLDRGYWFYGGIKYVAVSFWSGFDNLNKTPNISFIINQDESCHILFSAKDSDIKNNFFLKILYPSLNISQFNDEGQAEIKIEGNSTYLKKIDDFIQNKKVEIDKILEKEISFFADYKEPGIGFIDGRDFRLLFNRALKLRNAHRKISEPFINASLINIENLSIKNFGPIHNIEIPNFGLGNKWIFLTGENGCGKSAIFRAIAAAICNDHTHLTKGDYSNYEVSLQLVDGEKPFKRIFIDSDAHKKEPNLLFKGFAAYGASRLIVEEIKQEVQSESFHLTACDSIFNYCHPLLDLWTRIIQLQNRKGSSKDHVRLETIREVFYEVIDNLKTVLFPGEYDETRTYYIELDKENDMGFIPVPYDYLASGIRSIIALIGDLIVRFFELQTSALSPSDFRGIVIIDEIDVHLHPNFQKKIVETLDLIFPKIQFLVSTHSPIPLLGAPKNSAIYVVKRDYKAGVIMNLIDKKINIEDLLPNTILTSPIFGMNNLRSNSNKDIKKINIDGHFDEELFFKILKNKINEYTKAPNWEIKIDKSK